MRRMAFLCGVSIIQLVVLLANSMSCGSSLWQKAQITDALIQQEISHAFPLIYSLAISYIRTSRIRISALPTVGRGHHTAGTAH